MGNLASGKVTKERVLEDFVARLASVAILTSRFTNRYGVAFAVELSKVLIPYRRHIGREVRSTEIGLGIDVRPINVRRKDETVCWNG